MQSDDEVGQLVVGGAQVGVPFKGVVDQGACSGCFAVDRGGGAVCSVAVSLRELNPGADGADVGLVEELRARQGDRGLGDVGSALGHAQNSSQCRVGSSPGAAEEANAEFRFEGEAGALAELEALGERDDLAQGRGERAVDRERIARCAVAGEVGAVEADVDRSDVEDDTLQNLGQRVGDGGHSSRRGVEVNSCFGDHGAEVVGARHRWGDEGEAERRAFVGAGEVELAGGVVGGGSRSGGGGEAAYLRARGTGGTLLLLAAALGGGNGERRIGALLGPRQLRRQPRRRGDVDGGEVLGAVAAPEMKTKGVLLAAIGEIEPASNSGELGRARLVGGASCRSDLGRSRRCPWASPGGPLSGADHGVICEVVE